MSTVFTEQTYRNMLEESISQEQTPFASTGKEIATEAQELQT